MRALLCTALFAAVGGLAQAAAAEAPQRVELNFQDAELSEVVKALAEATGERFIFDSSLQGRITIALEDRVSVAEALEVLNAALLLRGFAMLPAPEGYHTILPLATGVGAAPWMPVERESDRLVTTIVRLEAADAAEVAQRIEPLSSGLLQPYAPTNSLIIATTEARLRRLFTIIRAIDHAAAVELRVIPLRYANASDVAAQLREAFPESRVAEAPYRIVADERTNSLIVEAPGALLAEIGRFVTSIDLPAPGSAFFRVVHVVNADAEELAQHLQGLSVEGSDELAARDYQVVADAPTNSLVIRADFETFAALARVIAELDHIPPLISLDVLLLQVETSTALDLDWSALFPIYLPDDVGDTVVFGTIGDDPSLLLPGVPTEPFVGRITRNPLVIPITLNGVPTQVIVPEAAAQVTAGEGDVSVETLARVSLLAASGEEQRIFSGDQVPIPVSGASAELALSTSVDIERRDVGLDVRVRPLAVSERLIELALDLNFSSVSEDATSALAAGTAGSSAGPVLTQFDLQATIRLPDGGIALVGSMPRPKLDRVESGVPFLRSIPILGNLARSTSEVERASRILVAVQATAIDSPGEQRAESILRRLALEREVARIAPLREVTDAPYALLVETLRDREAAERVSENLGDFDGSAVIVPWHWGRAERFDVYLVGFHEFSALGSVAMALRERGFHPKISVVEAPPR